MRAYHLIQTSLFFDGWLGAGSIEMQLQMFDAEIGDSSAEIRIDQLQFTKRDCGGGGGAKATSGGGARYSPKMRISRKKG